MMSGNTIKVLCYIQEALARNGQSPMHTYITFCKRCSPGHLRRIREDYQLSEQDVLSTLRDSLSLGLLQYDIYDPRPEHFHRLYFTKRGLDMVNEHKYGKNGKQQPQINLNNCANIQIGDGNVMNIQQRLEAQIDQSAGTPQEKEKAKSLLRTVMLDSILAPILTGLASGCAAVMIKG